MAIGTVTSVGDGGTVAYRLVDAAIANNSPPSGSSAGVAVSAIANYFGFVPSPMTVAVYSTAGSGTMTVTVKLWGYVPMASGKWLPIGTGADATRGEINAATAIGETNADSLTATDVVSNLGHYERVYAEILAIGGTSTAVTVELIGRR